MSDESNNKNTASSTQQEANQTTPVKETDYKIVTQAKAAKLNPRFQGEIGYEVGINNQDKQAAVRLVSNTGGGRFSKDWVLLRDIETILVEQPNDKPFRAKLLKQIWYRGSANNSGFLACVLVDLSLINLMENSHFNYLVTDNVKSKIEVLMTSQDNDAKASKLAKK
jgi:hypothetical protein